MKNLIFTFIFDDYDYLKEPLVVTDGWDYRCLSDCGIGSKIWKPVDVSEKVIGISDSKRKASLMKIDHYSYISGDYDLIMTLDGSMLLNVDLNRFVSEYWQDDADLLIAIHPHRNCLYDEALAVSKFAMDNPATVFHHVKRYMSEGYPKNNGLYGTRMMIKNNRSEKLKRVCKIWAREYMNGSRRDQLSLNYAIWKAKQEGINLKIIGLNFNYLYNESGMFQIKPHRKSPVWQ